VAGVSIRGVRRDYPGGVRALAAVDLELADGRFLALLGPSGSGKTTLLRAVAGLERLDAGEIWIGGRCVSAPDRHLPPEHRRVAVVFQNHALWPHMTLAANVAFPLEQQRVPAAQRRLRVEAALATVGLTGLDNRLPHQLSGGQQQRVALARALVAEPEVLLFDEPLASLDGTLRHELMRHTAALKDRGLTCLYVTHSQEEALALADTVAVMMQGRLVQQAPPAILLTEPATAEVAQLVGAQAVLPAEVLRVDAGRAEVRLHPAAPVWSMRTPSGVAPGPARCCIAPFQWQPSSPGLGLPLEVTGCFFQGSHWAIDVRVDAGAPRFTVQLPRGNSITESAPEPGMQLWLHAVDGWVLP